MHSWDEDDVEHDIDEEETALQALAALLEVEGNNALAWEQREALATVAVEALALQERRKENEKREAARRSAQRARRCSEEQAAREVRRREEARQALAARRAAHEREEAKHRGQEQREEPRRELPRRHQTTEHRPVEPTRVQKPLPSPPPALRARPARTEHDPPVRPLQVHRPPVATETDSAPLVSLTDVEPPKHQPTVPISSTTECEQLHLTGADLASWRARLGLTQQAAAERLGVRQGTVSKTESRPGVLLGPALHQALTDASKA